jgi:hypothetical protein
MTLKFFHSYHFTTPYFQAIMSLVTDPVEQYVYFGGYVYQYSGLYGNYYSMVFGMVSTTNGRVLNSQYINNYQR